MRGEEEEEEEDERTNGNKKGREKIKEEEETFANPPGPLIVVAFAITLGGSPRGEAYLLFLPGQGCDDYIRSRHGHRHRHRHGHGG